MGHIILDQLHHLHHYPSHCGPESLGGFWARCGGHYVRWWPSAGVCAGWVSKVRFLPIFQQPQELFHCDQVVVTLLVFNIFLLFSWAVVAIILIHKTCQYVASRCSTNNIYSTVGTTSWRPYLTDIWTICLYEWFRCMAHWVYIQIYINMSGPCLWIHLCLHSKCICVNLRRSDSRSHIWIY